MFSQANQRLRIARKELRLSMRAFAAPLEVSYQAVNHWEKGESPISAMIAGAIEKHHAISSKWLLEGVGDMFVTIVNPNKSLLNKVKTKFDDLKISGETELNNFYEQNSLFKVSVFEIPVFTLSLIGSETKPTKKLPFSTDWCFRRIGQSPRLLWLIEIDQNEMAPIFNHKDLVMIDRESPDLAFQEGVWVFKVGSAVHIRRIQSLESGHLQATSDDNQESNPFVLEEPFELIGRVVWSDKRW